MKIKPQDNFAKNIKARSINHGAKRRADLVFGIVDRIELVEVEQRGQTCDELGIDAREVDGNLDNLRAVGVKEGEALVNQPLHLQKLARDED